MRVIGTVLVLLGLSAMNSMAEAAVLTVTVIDAPDGNPLPAAKVSVFKGGKSLISKYLTDKNGEAVFRSLVDGADYSLTVEFDGFRTETVRNIVLGPGSDEHRRILLKRYVRISIAALLANPEQYDGAPVGVVGFATVGFENDVLYFHKEDWENGITTNALWLEIRPFGEKDYSQMDKRYVQVAGDFEAKNHGHAGLFAGTIKNVQIMIGWR